ncbi:MAG TPA: Ig-like domain repeat protein [Acidobacteriaceae bacterium]|nr:Ig-like domain repeat protein [Acidobacteriaceae bacterium]
MSRSASVLPALKRTFAPTRRIALALVAAVVLFCGAQQAYAGMTTCATIGNVGATISGAPFETMAPVSLVLGDVITYSVTGSVLEYPSAGGPGAGFFITGTGSYTITSGRGGTGTYEYEVSTPGTVTLSCTAPVNYVVTSTADDDGTNYASNCTATTATTGTGATGTSCTLRDALLSAANNTQVGSTFPSTIYFLPGLAGTGGKTPFTITETNGTLTLPAYTTIQGLTTGSGASLTNLVTVNGNNANSVFTVNSTSVTLNNLIITGGSTINGGGIDQTGGSLAISQSTITGNEATSIIGVGGGIYDNGGTSLAVSDSTIADNSSSNSTAGIYIDSGAMTISNSTISNNSASVSSGFGGGIGIDTGSLTVTLTNVTVSGNSAAVGGGMAMLSGMTLTNSIVSGNSAVSGEADIVGSYTDGGGNVVGTSTSDISNGTAVLAPLGNYGGPTPTMAELPSSTSICAGSGGSGNDQRGVARTTTYTSSCTDSGATQAHYGVGFTTQPASTYVQNANFGNTTAPVISLEDDGYPISYTDPTAAVILYDTDGVLGGFDTTYLNSGSATYSGAYATSGETTDALTENLRMTVYGQGTQTYTGANSNTFSVTALVAGFNVSTLSGVSAGTAQNITITALSSLSPATTATGFTGTVTVTSTDAAATINGVTIGTGTTLTFNSANNGVLALTGSNGIVFKTAGSQTVTITYTTVTGTSNSVTITAAAAATISAATGSGQSATIGAALTNPLVVQVLDAYSNPIGGNAVTFTAPSTGASATLSNSSTCTTSLSNTPAGSCSVTAIANGISNSAASYSVTAKATGITAPATFTLTNTQATITLTVTASPTALVYGEPLTITATSSQLNVGGSTPTGAVTFYDSTTTLSPTGTLGGSFTSASYNTIAQLGERHYGASLAADTNFNAVSRTNATTIVVGKASSTLTGPTTQPVQITVNTAGSVPVTVTGQYSGTGVSTPSGSIGYTIGSPCAASCTGTATITSGAATIPTLSTLAPGPYTIAVTYAGDTNYNAATSINVSIQVGKLTPTDTLQASATSILTQNQETLTATISFSAGSTPTGSVNFMDGLTLLSTVPLTNGVAVLNTSTLSIGSHSITAVYSGDANYATVTSAAQSITVLDFSLAISTTAGSITSVTVLPGATATYQLTISPVGASTFPATVNLTATGLPAGATYTITPSSITAGSGATTVTLSIITPAASAQNSKRPTGLGRELAPVTLALLLLPFSRRLRRRAGKLGRLTAMLLLLVAGSAAVVGLSGCGGGTSGFFTQPVSSSTVTVTGTSGTLTHSTTVTLTIE